MTIYRKEQVAPYLADLEVFYERLRNALQGVPDSASMADRYHANTKQVSMEFVDIDLVQIEKGILLDLAQIEKAISHVKIELYALKHLKRVSGRPATRRVT